MNVLIVCAHPEPSSFTGALKDAAVRALATAGHHVEVSDLYAEGFNPVAGRLISPARPTPRASTINRSSSMPAGPAALRSILSASRSACAAPISWS